MAPPPIQTLDPTLAASTIAPGPMKTLSPIFCGWCEYIERWMRRGGCKTEPCERRVYFPIVTDIVCCWVCWGCAGGSAVRNRSPRITDSVWITVRPPSMMFVVPWICDLRDTLLPVSWMLSAYIRSGRLIGHIRGLFIHELNIPSQCIHLSLV